MESGLVSLGGDTDDETNPFEVRLGQYVDLGVADDVVGIQALRKIASDGPKRHQLGVVMEGETPVPFGFDWEQIEHNGHRVGDLTMSVWSPRMKANIGYALVSRDLEAGSEVIVQRPSGTVSGKLVELPFL